MYMKRISPHSRGLCTPPYATLETLVEAVIQVVGHAVVSAVEEEME